jgi:hypothetical protein
MTSIRSYYKLAICHLHHPCLHGYTESSDTNISGHYLIYYTINLNEFYNKGYIDNLILDLSSYYEDIILMNHPLIGNYNKIIKKENYIKVDIIQMDTLSGMEEVGYIKTFWIKILQRKWKLVYKKRKEMIQRILSNPKYLLKREINGKMRLK